MGKFKQAHEDKLDSNMCNDCPTIGDIQVTFDKCPDIIVCDSCFNKYYYERPEPVKKSYR
tara:strand:+ start:809 stop:988 length:180 start_codon:yes stop_codon:yes gene_type:complete